MGCTRTLDQGRDEDRMQGEAGGIVRCAINTATDAINQGGEALGRWRQQLRGAAAEGSLAARSLITISPSGPCSSLSMPLGPSEVRSTRETAFAAWMLLFTASIPLMRDFLSCSCIARAASLGDHTRTMQASPNAGPVSSGLPHPYDDEWASKLIERQTHGCWSPRWATLK